MGVAVVTDTTHYLRRASRRPAPRGLAVRQLGRATDRESDITDYEAYYEYLRTAAELPTTSQPSVGDFLEAFEPLAADGADIVSIHLSGGISGTYESALSRQGPPRRAGHGARKSRCSTPPPPAAAWAASCSRRPRARAGADAEASCRAQCRPREALKIWFCVDTMEFLRRGGRVGAARAGWARR